MTISIKRGQQQDHWGQSSCFSWSNYRNSSSSDHRPSGSAVLRRQRGSPSDSGSCTHRSWVSWPWSGHCGSASRRAQSWRSSGKNSKPGLHSIYVKHVLFLVPDHMRRQHIEWYKIGDYGFFLLGVRAVNHIGIYHSFPGHEVVLYLLVRVDELHFIFSEINKIDTPCRCWWV